MKTIRKIAIAGVVVSVMVFANLVYGVSEASETQAEVKLQQVALFKNGLGFFVSEVVIPKKKKEFERCMGSSVFLLDKRVVDTRPSTVRLEIRRPGT